jgi:Zn-dependent M28 family amino/carboxypeptidase
VLIVVAGLIALFVIAIRQPTCFAPHFDAHSHADAARLRRDVDSLTSRNRCADNPQSLNETAAFIAAEFRATGANVSMQPFIARRHEYQNVIARFGPRGNAPIVIGAHYDAFCEPHPLPGADDNASGVAALLELARLLAREKLSVPITLIAFANEEPPFYHSDEMGSVIHARSLRGTASRVVILEMIGCFTEEQPAVSPLLSLLFYPRRGDFLAVVGRWNDIALTREVKRAMSDSMNVVSSTGPAFEGSDHESYWHEGFRAVMITDTAYLRNPRYHTARDTANTLDYARMAKTTDALLAYCALATDP